MSRGRIGHILSFLALLFLTAVLPASASTPRTLIATVQRVSDGDTLVAVAVKGTKLRLRVLGIDALETAHKTTPRMVWEVG